nr:hypothetical protein [Kitasatospora sp. SID7827]
MWAVADAATQLGWAAAGTTVPWTAHTAYPRAALLPLALAALLAGAAAVAAGTGWEERGGRYRRHAVTAVLLVTVPLYAAGSSGLPVHFVQLATLSGLESATGLAQVLLDTAGATLLILTALTRRRRHTGRCPRCGQPHPGPAGGELRHPAPTPPGRRTRTAAYLLLLGLLPWAGVKTVWTLGGDALGITAEAWAASAADGTSGVTRALAELGVDVTVFAAAVGVLLLLGLLQRWGQTFPRPLPLLGGRRVPRLLPLVPAWLTGAPLAMYGLVLTALAPLLATGALPAPSVTPPFTSTAGLLWMTEFGGLAFTGLGRGLLLAARSYAARTRPVCAGTERETAGGGRETAGGSGKTAGGGGEAAGRMAG